MNYHGITKTSVVNGEGLRVVLWVSGCNHQCEGCHNPETWDPKSGMIFDSEAKAELFKALKRSWIDGLTLSGGDPLHPVNVDEITALVKEIKEIFPHKTIWLYTGYTYRAVQDLEVLKFVDVIVTGPFIKELADPSYKYAGSTNQEIIRLKEV